MADDQDIMGQEELPENAVGGGTDIEEAARARAEAEAAAEQARHAPLDALKSGWRDAWQVPTLLVAGGMLMLGVAYSVSTSPDPDTTPMISKANLLIEREDYEEAIDLLNTRVYPWMGKEETPRENKVAYHLAKARSIYRGQQKLRLDDDRNHVSVVREYLEAERLGGVLEPRDLASLADTYLSRDEVDLAMQRAREIPESRRYLRDEVQKRAVESLLDRTVPETEKAMQLLAEMLVDPALPVEERVWALETQGNVRLAQGNADETVTRILRAIPRLDEASGNGRSRLHLVLSKAYLQMNAVEQARLQIDHAGQLSARGDAHYPEILLMKAMVEDNQGNTDVARDHYSEIVISHPSSSAYPLALLGLGETEAALGQGELSLEAFGALVEQYDGFGIESYPSRKQILDSLLARASDSLSAGAPYESIRYASLADALYRGREVPTEVYAASAFAHQAAAEQLLGMPIDEVRTLMGLDASARAEVQRHLMAAATNFGMHAERHVVNNLPRFADSLWRSANLFDRAGDQPEAIRAFKTYAESMPSDPRHAEALFRLAEALRSLGDFKAAADVYQGLIEARQGVAGADIGPFADASHVPLAQAYLYDEDTANDAEAEKLLVKALHGSMGSTQTDFFRDALLELGGLYDRTDRPERAIERYDEFLERYPNDPEAGAVIFKLADAHRRLADIIERSLQEAMPAAERNRRLADMDSHRRRAINQYEQTIRDLDALPESGLGHYESIALRNAHFYLGDCAYDLGEYNEAIGYYDRARDRYVDDPASLVAMVQIVNAYIATDQLGRARTANERAKRFYAMIPDDVWDDPSLPMDREDWERWLNSTAVLLVDAAS
ncbi:MAG: tetratricopeptide repeat protein [Phycisphaerales bacterium]